MKYYKNNIEITKEEARLCLKNYYAGVDDVIDNRKSFCLQTPYGNIWTRSDDGLVPIPGFYGIL